MKIIIVPDVHGRTFWRKTIELIDNVDKVIFLGDYLDPYPDIDGIFPHEALIEFKNILEFKKSHPDKVILLLGNHDVGYFPEMLDSYSCRRWEKSKEEISNLFMDNLDLFQLIHIEEDCLFSHAGVQQGWLNFIKDDKFLENWEINNKEFFKTLNLENLNKLLLLYEDRIKVLWQPSRERGGRFGYGSCIWTDIHEHLSYFRDPLPNYYQIFAHSLYYPELEEYYKDNDIAMLDCAKLFILENKCLEMIN